VMVVCDRHGSEPEFSLWKQNLDNNDGAISRVIGQSHDTRHPTHSSSPTSTHTDTHDVDDLLATRTDTVDEKMSTEETRAFKPPCAASDRLSTEDRNSGGLSCTRSTNTESSSVLDKQQLELVRPPPAGVAELPATASISENNVHSSAKSASTEPVESHDGENSADTVPDALLPSSITSSDKPMVSSLLADSEAAGSSSVKTAVSYATSDTDPLGADDMHSLDADQVDEPLSSANIHNSASEPQMVCGSLCYRCDVNIKKKLSYYYDTFLSCLAMLVCDLVTSRMSACLFITCW